MPIPLLSALLASPLAVPGGLVLLSASLLLSEQKKKAALAQASAATPHFDAEARSEMLATAAEEGFAVQSFKTPIAAVIVRALGRFALIAEESPNGGLLFRVAPPDGDLSAAQAVLQAQAAGLTVLGS